MMQQKIQWRIYDFAEDAACENKLINTLFKAIKFTILLTPIGALEPIAINAPDNTNGTFWCFFNFILFH